VPTVRVDNRPQWERDDEDAEHRLTAQDRALIAAGAGAAARSGLLAGLLLGAVPAVLVLLLRAVLGGGWRPEHWVWNLLIYSALVAAAGPAMGLLRRWSCLGHRFGTVPLAGTRASWDTWLGLIAVDAFVVWALIQDNLGVLLLFVLIGLVWLGLLYSIIWAALQARLLQVGAPSGRSVRSLPK